MAINWTEIDHARPPAPEQAMVLTNGELTAKGGIGGYFGDLWLTDGGQTPEDWWPTHYSEINLPS